MKRLVDSNLKDRIQFAIYIKYYIIYIFSIIIYNLIYYYDIVVL